MLRLAVSGVSSNTGWTRKVSSRDLEMPCWNFHDTDSWCPASQEDVPRVLFSLVDESNAPSAGAVSLAPARLVNDSGNMGLLVLSTGGIWASTTSLFGSLLFVDSSSDFSLVTVEDWPNNANGDWSDNNRCISGKLND